MGGFSLADVEVEGQSYSANDVEVAPAPKQYLPAVNQAVASVPRPAPPRGLRPTPELPAPRWQDYLGTAVGAFTGVAPGAESGIPSLGPPVAQGLKEMGTPGKRVTGALRTAEAGTEALTPLMGPAIMENPVALGRGLAEGVVAQKGVEYGAKKIGATPEQAALAGDVAMLAPGIARSVIRPQVGVASTPEGTAVAGTAFGGKAGAGVAVTPEGVTLRGKVGPFEGSKTFSRGAPAAPAIEPPTIEGVTRAQAADYLDKAGWDPDKARSMAAADQKAAAVPQEPAVSPKPAVPTPEVIPPPKAATVAPKPQQTISQEFKASDVEIQSGNGAANGNRSAIAPRGAPSRPAVPVRVEQNEPQGPALPSTGPRENE
jgi:hypothetical protein